MKIALYGMPCAGKTSLMNKISNAKVVYGGQELRRICGGSFSELTEIEKRAIRIKYTEYIRGLEDEMIISDGHYSFMEHVVFTEADGELYDVFLYLYCKPEVLLNRYGESEKNKNFAKYPIAVIESWQEFEIKSLRAQCHKKCKDFYVISDNETDCCAFFDFLECIKNGFSSYGLAEKICWKIREFYPEPGRLMIADGDKTIIRQDSYRFCGNGTTTVFDGNFYTGYQSFLFKRELQNYLYDPNRVSDIEINENIWREVRNKDYVILSSGISDLWKRIKEQKGFKHVFADPLISADTKYFVVKLLKKYGYTVFAYGDSGIDVYMLHEADEGTIYIGKRMSASLKGESLEGIHLIYDHSPYILEEEREQDVLRNIAVCRSDSGINGGRLAEAHLCLGMKLGDKMARLIPQQGTALLILERGGRFFGDGLYAAFGGTFYAINPSKDSVPQMKADRIIIVDSVINTGRSIFKIISQIEKDSPKTDVIIAANVIQKDAFQLFYKWKVFAVRVSENSFVGKNQAKQEGKAGPDTADRLYNLIEKRF